MKRFGAAILAGLALVTGPARAGEAKRPNVVIVLADDLGWGDLGCYGNPVIQTPHLDAFAKQGMRFTQCYSAGSVCSPSRSAILTGRTPYRNGVFTWIPEGRDIYLRTSEVTLPTLLRRAGYATCHVGKWHLNGLFNSAKQPQPGDHGYDWWLGTQNNAAPSHKNPNNFVRNGKAVGPLDGYSAPLVVDEAVRWLTKERDAKKPFFLSVCTHEPHLPIESDPAFQGLYPKLVKEQPDVAQHHGNVTQLDAAFGKLMRTLAELGLAENTLVVFTSDNGPEGQGNNGRTRGSTGGLRGRKRSLYQGGIRVPGIMRWAGQIPAGSTSEQPIIGSDLFVSVLKATGVEPPKDRVLDGTDVAPAWKQQPIDRKIPMYWRYHGAGKLQIAIRDGDWNLLATPDLKTFELYDLKKDPTQTRDLVETEKARFDAMRATLVRLNAEIEAEGPTWWRGYQDNPKKKKKDAE